ncbi:hypothetical protein BD289DRAFT_231580 [Coniella lustricola]|uniref:Uncharacterized protein n=1 Tax=Coniella lustricola TaxID=2025994 RepID=A0A2T3AA71_9PEZI|nr:hypothetical protein BD289DRAFT_231580 [Coniella lustricola]
MGPTSLMARRALSQEDDPFGEMTRLALVQSGRLVADGKKKQRFMDARKDASIDSECVAVGKVPSHDHRCLPSSHILWSEKETHRTLKYLKAALTAKHGSAWYLNGRPSIRYLGILHLLLLAATTLIFNASGFSHSSRNPGCYCGALCPSGAFRTLKNGLVGISLGRKKHLDARYRGTQVSMERTRLCPGAKPRKRTQESSCQQVAPALLSFPRQQTDHPGRGTRPELLHHLG